MLPAADKVLFVKYFTAIKFAGIGKEIIIRYGIYNLGPRDQSQETLFM